MAKQIHILMIDDDQVIQRLMGARLSQAGYQVLYANDGPAGREMARRFLPDLVLLDIRMPGLDGYEIAKLLRGEERTRNIPVIFLTNEDLSMEGEKWARELWVADYIHKSVDPEELLKRIEHVLKVAQEKKAERPAPIEPKKDEQ